MAASAEIGRVVWGDPPRVAILRTDGTWDVPDNPELAAGLTVEFLPAFRAMGPAEGFRGVAQLHDWARACGGTVHLEPFPPLDPRADY